MISRRSRWLFTSAFALTALLTHVYRAHAVSGPVSIPVQLCTYKTSVVNEYPQGPTGYVTDTWYTWTCPYISLGNSNSAAPGADDWKAQSVVHSFLDYTFPTTTANDKLTFTACEMSYSAGTAICSGVTSDSTTGYHETLGAGFSTLVSLGASGSFWDYYYVQAQAYNVGVWTQGNRTYNPPTLYGVGFN